MPANLEDGVLGKVRCLAAKGGKFLHQFCQSALKRAAEHALGEAAKCLDEPQHPLGGDLGVGVKIETKIIKGKNKDPLKVPAAFDLFLLHHDADIHQQPHMVVCETDRPGDLGGDFPGGHGPESQQRLQNGGAHRRADGVKMLCGADDAGFLWRLGHN